jgi:hypothetical protein
MPFGTGSVLDLLNEVLLAALGCFPPPLMHSAVPERTATICAPDVSKNLRTFGDPCHRSPPRQSFGDSHVATVMRPLVSTTDNPLDRGFDPRQAHPPSRR